MSPSPEVGMKFQTQSEDVINGNNFVNRCLVPLEVRRHKHFQRFFSTQPPLWMPLSTAGSPNQKLDSFLKWIIDISKKSRRLSKKNLWMSRQQDSKGGILLSYGQHIIRKEISSSVTPFAMMGKPSRFNSATSRLQSSTLPQAYLLSILE